MLSVLLMGGQVDRYWGVPKVIKDIYNNIKGTGTVIFRKVTVTTSTLKYLRQKISEKQTCSSSYCFYSHLLESTEAHRKHPVRVSTQLLIMSLKAHELWSK